MQTIVGGREKRSLAMEMLRTTGLLRLQATGSSMLPALWPGDTLTIEACDRDYIKPGDIVFFARDGRYFIHRVLRKSPGWGGQVLITRGDSLPQNDPPIRNDELLGRVSGIQRGDEHFAPVLLSPWMAILGRILAYSDFCRRIALRWHELRRCACVAGELAPFA